jgi:TPP-dependent pyruvate/acetoin dehydrogenase alpha subunit
MSVTAPTADDAQIEATRLLDMLASVHEIRFFEQYVQDWCALGVVRGNAHLCQGQEAVAVGVAAVLGPGDTATCTYRGHGTVLALGAPLDESFAEILGKRDGLCAGKGGSMHLTDVRVGALGSSAVVGGNLPISAGAAWAAQLLGTGAVNVCLFGDGAANTATFHETLNLAGLWQLPVIFVIENNLYGGHTPSASTTADTNLSQRAGSYGMPGLRIDGNDLLAVRTAATAAVSRARRGDGPTVVEAMTYRQGGHSQADPASYRPPGELEHWLERDPIRIAESHARRWSIAPAVLDELREQAETRVHAAAERALSWPDASAESRLAHVWTSR